ncbi:tryptophan 2,3-dioxygenase [Streptosporangium carneum]|uniref:Tryptophan 2,3-dioxygenase n=1 Tax=Streptosporangium carneum TaxID=47481 RepID=A0A9W6I6W2_9ACTN|nr:tryptophan 2,3-dioxygenase family protein [Streptosporangium carneum]GLK12344.1 tryptophan 2,3-dioxygenase [Streptosporangium carneum]
MEKSASHDRCPVRPLSEEEREERARLTNGEPVADFGANPFVSYLADDILLSLQNPRTKEFSEPAFLIMSQVVELLFKLAHTEARQARDLLDLDDVAGALWVFRRLSRVQNVLTDTWEVLSSLSPVEYGAFRDQLGEGSGLQSSMYRHLEFILGNKNEAMVTPHRGDPAVHRELRRALGEPSLYDAALRLLRRRGFPVPQDCAERDWALPYEERQEVADAWQLVYQDPDRHLELHQLAEALVDIAYDFGRWRAAHLLTVERLLGSKAGTGGTSGVRWLRRVAEHRFFPELWLVRSGI